MEDRKLVAALEVIGLLDLAISLATSRIPYLQAQLSQIFETCLSTPDLDYSICSDLHFLEPIVPKTPRTSLREEMLANL